MRDGRSNTYLSYLEKVINEINPTLILCVLSLPRGNLYSLIKQKLCIDRAGKYFIKTFLYHLYDIFNFIV